MKLKHLIACLMAGTLPFTSCIKDEAPNAEADILSCMVPQDILQREPTIQNNSVTILVKPYADITHQAPEFTLTEGATIEPASGTVLDFSSPQRYTVTSESGEWEKIYTVSFVIDDLPTYYTFQDTLVTEQSQGRYFVFSMQSEQGLPVEWANGNPGFSLTGVAKTAYDYPTVQDENGYIGKCAKLITRDTGSFGSQFGMPIAAGNLFMGSFNLATALTDALKSTRFGYPFYYKPISLSGYYKFTAGPTFYSQGKEVPGRKDIFNIYAMFYEMDKDGTALDGYFKAYGYTAPNLVALALIDNPQETTQWTRFEIPFRYDYGKEIDLQRLKEGGYNIAIVFSSSIDGDVFDGAPGSTLWLDEVTLSYETLK